MKTMKTLMVMMIGLSLLLAAGTVFADGRQRHGGYYYGDQSHSKNYPGAYHHEKQVYVNRHAYRYPVGPRYAWGCYPGYPYRVDDRRVYREYGVPYEPAYTYGRVYRPAWSFGISFGW